MKIGDTFSHSIVVDEIMAASNDVEGVPHVFGTPSLVALIEEMAHKFLKSEFKKGQTSVGMTLELEHTSPTPIGMEVMCEVMLVSREGIFADFEIRACDESGTICSCRHRRAIVNKEKIEDTAQKKFAS